jgi:hypothetical protein
MPLPLIRLHLRMDRRAEAAAALRSLDVACSAAALQRGHASTAERLQWHLEARATR